MKSMKRANGQGAKELRWLAWWRGIREAGPERAVFARLFRRLLFWYVSLLAVLVILLGISIGSTVPWLVVTSSGHDLSEKLGPLVQRWQTAPGSPCQLTTPGHGYMLACYDSRGQVIHASGVGAGVQKHFLDNTLALSVLQRGEPTARDALDETGTGQVQFDFVFLSTTRPAMVRQAMLVREPATRRVLGVVQLGTTPAETLARRTIIVRIFFLCMFLAVLFGAPAGGWYLASKALLPARLAFQRQRDFIANVSHELGTPLALVRANADVLLLGREHLAEDDVALVEDIVTETAYMDKMIDNMLLLARMDAGQLRLEKEALDLAKLAEEAVRRMQPLAHQARVTLVCQSEEPAQAQADRALLQQVTLILLDNAIKYTPSDGSVSVSTFKDHERACLRVSDSGMGIAPAELARLGTRFYRVDKARSRETGGSGLGLSIARGILSAHGGELLLTSKPGKGTTATILLPSTRV
jgi:signal transduction histidine kinase